MSFVAGLAIGLLLGLVSAVVLVYYLHPVWTCSTPASPLHGPPDPVLLRRRARFSAYLHE